MKHASKIFYLWGLCISTHLFARPVPLLTEDFVDTFHFKLNNDKSYCQLSIRSPDDSITQFPLASQSPCYFFGDHEKKKIQTYSYKEAHIEHILFIGGTAVTLTDEQRQSKKMPIDSYCTQNIQAITIETGKVKLGNMNTAFFACAEDRLDEKIYQQVTKQPRVNIEVFLQEQKEKRPTVNRGQVPQADVPFFEGLQQKIEAIFK